MLSDQTDYHNSVKGTGVSEGTSLGRVAIPQYAPGRHRETGCDSLSLSSNEHQIRQTNSVARTSALKRSGNRSVPNKQRTKKQQVQSKHNISIGTINVRTAKEEIKLAEHVIHVKNLHHDICFLQETHKIGSGEVEFHDPILKGWRVIYTGFKRKAQAGVGIVLAPHVCLEDILDVEQGRILGARVNIHGLKLSIFCCYAPTDTKSYSDQTKDAFYNTLRKATSNVKKDHPSYKLVVGGDFNATIGTDSQAENLKCIGQNNDSDPTSENGHRLLQFAQEHSLSILNSFFGYKNIHRWSFYSNLGYSRRLDYILGEWFIKRFTTNCRVYRGASTAFESDHRVVVLNCSFPCRKQMQSMFTKKKKQPHYDIKQLRENETVVQKYSEKMDELFVSAEKLDSVDDINDTIVNIITRSTAETIPVKSKSTDSKPWADNEFITLISERNNCQKKQDWKQINVNVKKMRNKLKNQYYCKKATAINVAHEARNVEEQFRLAKSYSALSNSKHLLIRPELLTSHFKSHFSERKVIMQPEAENPNLYPHVLPPDDIKINQDPPSEEEVLTAIKSLNNNKCQGTDHIYAEQLKYATSKHLLVKLLLLLTTIWTTATVPVDWLKSSMSCLHKKGPRSNPGNYRALSIMSTVSKLLPKIILLRMRDAYESLIMENQFGFRKNRSTTDAIFITCEAIKSTKHPLFLCMIDLRAAYDHIDRNLLFRVLEFRTKAPKIINILKSLYTGTIAAIKHTDDLFRVHTGCRQGGLESPVLFNIYMDFVLRCAEYEVLQKFPNTGLKYSYRINSESTTREQRSIHTISGIERLRMLLYADDIVLFCEDITELQCILNIYDKTFSRFGLTIAIDKTKTITFNVNEEIMCSESLISLRGTPIDNVRQFKYLGYLLSNDESKSFLNQQISSAYSKWSEIKHILLDRKIFLNIRIRFLEAYVRSRLLYSVQSCQLSAKDLNKIDVIWNGFLRRMVKGGFDRKNVPKNKDQIINKEELDWSHKINNKRLLEITKTTSIKSFCQKQHLKYVAHITRLGNNALQKQFLFASSENRRHCRWIKMSKLLEIDESQIRRTMLKRTEFMQLLDHIFKTK